MVHDDSVVTIQECIHDLYTPIDAAGGVTYNEDGNVLMIFRRGKWDLPKGKRDEGESMDACALREVCEETGLQRLQLDQKICDTYHIYAQDQELIMKRTTWYRMYASAAEKLKPQKEENIIEARWVADHEMPLFATKTYEAVRDVLRAAGLKW
jgi:ADP-ribose pyrophosphatase YjhB (NUDIX family)